jgi:hypothetical protein
MADPTFYKASGDTLPNMRIRLDEIEKELKTAYGRWEELEEIKELSGIR